MAKGIRGLFAYSVKIIWDSKSIRGNLYHRHGFFSGFSRLFPI